MTNTIAVFIPTAEPKIKKISINPRVHDLNGKVESFLRNEKPNDDVLLLRLTEHLTQKFDLVGTEWGQIGEIHV